MKVSGELDYNEWKDVIGYEKKGMEALLTLLNYRVFNSEDINVSMSRLFEFDCIPLECGFLSRTVIIPILAFVFHFKLKNRNQNDKKSFRVLMSPTFIRSERNITIKKELNDSYGYYHMWTRLDSLEFNASNGWDSLKKTWKKSRESEMGVLLPYGELCVSGHKLQRLCYMYCLQWMMSRNSGKHADENYIKGLMDDIETEYKRRIKKVKKWIVKNKIDAFVTVNQFKLRDLIIIEACHDLGVNTINMDHAVMQIADASRAVEGKIKSIAFTKKILVWNEYEKEFRKRFYTYYNPLYKSDNNISVCGSIELSYYHILDCLKKYHKGKRIVYMEMGWDVDQLRTPEDEHKYKEIRKTILEQLKDLSDRTGFIIRVRYRPYWHEEFRVCEKPILDQYGFEVSESAPENLIQDILESSVVISGTSNVLCLSSTLQRETYMIVEQGVQCVIFDENIKTVEINGISELTPDNDKKNGKLNRDSFFDVERFYGECKK